jgi:N-acetyl-alpha-D-muramate 1-phosphate uridylyltransferase
MNLSAFILCGGKSTRLKSSGFLKPKPLIIYKNREILSHNLNLIKKIKIDNCLINCSEKINEYKKVIKKFKFKKKILLEKKQHGTSGSIIKNLKLLSDNILIIYGDNYLELDINKFINYFVKSNADMLIGVYKKKDLSKSGEMVFNKNILKKIIEKNKNNKNKSGYANSGLYIIKKEVLKFFNKVPSDFATDIINPLCREKKVKVFKSVKKCVSFDTYDLLKKNNVLK